MMATQEAVFGDDLGGVGKQTAGQPIPNIGEVTDEAAAPPETPAATADNEPVSPYLAARRYGADAGYGRSRGTT